ncbi:MAG: hypothetical protein AAGP08_00355 [Pseudomonadota bacterium]
MRAYLSILFLALASSAAAAADCTLANNYCVPVYGCIAATGETFQGNTFGQRKGPLQVSSSAGRVCQGNWRRTAFGGRASVACNDGRKGTIRFNYFNAQTGTVGGIMALNDGSEVEVFAGHRVSAFLKSGAKVRGRSPTCRPMIEQLLANP